MFSADAEPPTVESDVDDPENLYASVAVKPSPHSSEKKKKAAASDHTA